jgi:membrane protease YdiL (CAAX protease family)
LAVSGLFSGGAGAVLYVFAFAFPILIAPAVFKKTDKYPLKLYTGRGESLHFLPLVFPVILLVFSLSSLTGLLLSYFGFSNTEELSGNIFVLIVRHALLPAILEEGLYRYLIITVIARYSKRGAVLYSALFFAFAHGNLFQIPYAFLAGALFALLDIAFDSVLPSVIIHFTNNLLSIILTVYLAESQDLFLFILLALSLASVPFIFVLRRVYAEKIKERFTCDGKIEYSYEILVFIIMMALVAVLSLF